MVAEGIHNPPNRGDMKIEIHVHHHNDSSLKRIGKTVKRAVGLLEMLNDRIETMDAKFQPLADELSRLTTVTAGLSAVFNKLLDDVEEARNDPEEIAELVATARASIDELAALTVKGTDAEGEDTNPGAGGEDTQPAGGEGEDTVTG